MAAILYNINSAEANSAQPKIKRRGYKSDQLFGDDRAIHLYIMGSAGLLKIGLAENVKKRLAQIQLSSALPVTLLASKLVRADGAGNAEHMAHVALSEYHAHGEWFACPLDVALDAVEASAIRANREAARKRRRGSQPLTEAEAEYARKVMAEYEFYRDRHLCAQPCSPIDKTA